MTAEKMKRVERILLRMNVDLTRAIEICESIGRSILDEKRHEFWALVKYIENVQDGIVKLDNINKTIFPKLDEFPETSQNDEETSWKSLKGMRSRLAHAYDNINPEILWETVIDDFPRLTSLLRLLQFMKLESGKIRVGFRAGLWRTLPRVDSGENLGAGNSIPCIMFEESGEAACVRIGRIADDKMAIRTSKGIIEVTEISLVDPDDGDSVERLWPSGAGIRK